MTAPFLRSASAADLPPGFRWLTADESTAAHDMLWDMSLAQWVPIARAFTGLHVRHFTSVIRRSAAPAAAPAPAPPAMPQGTTRQEATAAGYRSFTHPYTEEEAAELQRALAGLEAKGTPFLIVDVTCTRSGNTKNAREIWIPKKAPRRSYQP